MEKELNEQESLALIQSMLKTVKEEIDDDSFSYLFWGWMVFTASMTQFILIQMNVEMNYLGWLILMPAGGIISAIHGRNKDKKKRVHTYIDEMMKYVLIAFLVSLFIILFFMWKLQLGTYPMIMIVYGIWLFISGGSLRFKPIIIGGIVNWMLAIISFFYDFNIQLLLLAAAVLLGYIIPGYMLKRKFSKSQVAV